MESKFTRQMLGRSVRIALSQAVLGVVADVIISDESLVGVLDTAEIKPLRRFVMSNLSTSRTWNITLQKIVQELRSEGIDPYVLKGQGIAQYYPNPDLRQCGDIDLYVDTTSTSFRLFYLTYTIFCFLKREYIFRSEVWN